MCERFSAWFQTLTHFCCSTKYEIIKKNQRLFVLNPVILPTSLKAFGLCRAGAGKKHKAARCFPREVLHRVLEQNFFEAFFPFSFNKRKVEAIEGPPSLSLSLLKRESSKNVKAKINAYIGEVKIIFFVLFL